MRRREAYTYRAYQQLAKELPEDVLAFMPFTCLHDKQHDYEYYWFREVVGGINEEPAQLAGATLGPPYVYKFRSLCLHVPKYTQWLVAQLERDMPPPAGPPVEFVRIAAASSLRAAAQVVKDATLLVNATGLGSQDLADVRDEKLYPIRGQTVLVNAPRFREESVARCINSLSGSGPSYVIPRARSGQVILGGSFDVRQTRPLTPNNQLTERIIKDAIRQAPELLPDGVDPQDPDAWKKLDVIRVNVGVRPAREGGVRIELETKPISLEGRQVGVIHAYGIGTYSQRDARTLTARTRWLPGEPWHRRRGGTARGPVADAAAHAGQAVEPSKAATYLHPSVATTPACALTTWVGCRPRDQKFLAALAKSASEAWQVFP